MEAKGKILQEFKDQLLDPRVSFTNEFLESLLGNNPKIKDLLVEHFKMARPGYDGLKTFNLKQWVSFGGDSNPTLEIVQIENRFLFGLTSYGILSSLKNEIFISHKKAIMDVILDFFVNPEKFLKK